LRATYSRKNVPDVFNKGRIRDWGRVEEIAGTETTVSLYNLQLQAPYEKLLEEVFTHNGRRWSEYQTSEKQRQAAEAAAYVAAQERAEAREFAQARADRRARKAAQKQRMAAKSAAAKNRWNQFVENNRQNARDFNQTANKVNRDTARAYGDMERQKAERAAAANREAEARRRAAEAEAERRRNAQQQVTANSNSMQSNSQNASSSAAGGETPWVYFTIACHGQRIVNGKAWGAEGAVYDDIKVIAGPVAFKSREDFGTSSTRIADDFERSVHAMGYKPMANTCRVDRGSKAEMNSLAQSTKAGWQNAGLKVAVYPGWDSYAPLPPKVSNSGGTADVN
jgi:chemotaxis protein histidine kinase CheA